MLVADSASAVRGEWELESKSCAMDDEDTLAVFASTRLLEVVRWSASGSDARPVSR